MVSQTEGSENLPENNQTSLGSIPKTQEEAMKRKEQAKKNAMATVPGSQTSIAQTLGIPADLANMFFMKLGESLYIKVAGLEYLAGKQGIGRTEITDHYDADNEEWVAEAKIYPQVTPKMIEAVSKLTPELQKVAFDELMKPTNGIGRASKNTVKMTTMLPFLREMAQTRAKGRALRAYTHYGSTSYEEMPEAVIDAEEGAR